MQTLTANPSCNGHHNSTTVVVATCMYVCACIYTHTLQTGWQRYTHTHTHTHTHTDIHLANWMAKVHAHTHTDTHLANWMAKVHTHTHTPCELDGKGTCTHTHRHTPCELDGKGAVLDAEGVEVVLHGLVAAVVSQNLFPETDA